MTLITGTKTCTQKIRCNCKMKRIRINGIVQGVGFRPFVYRIATAEKLTGYVLNDTNGVEIEVEGPEDNLKSFEFRLKTEIPPAARIEYYHSEQFPDKGYENFNIERSSQTSGSTLISPDLAVCQDCLREFNDPRDPRYQYAFINCTNCGPRYSIIEATPYDRPVTSMKSFNMCNYCNSEYIDPLNRRFHAQPVACPECGPQLIFLDNNLKPVSGDPIRNTISALQEGKIVGVKGIGGFHIACDARNSDTIDILRERKLRPDKPFAVMSHPDHISKLVKLKEGTGEILASPAAPIVILEKSAEHDLPENIAPGNPNLGVFLPYAPHHYQLLSGELDYLIMTSGNRKDEPIALQEADLEGLCDCFLTHDRPILNRSDDSIILPLENTEILLRRSRGFVPTPEKNTFELLPTLGCGAELKMSFALANETQYYLSPYLGNSGSKETMDFYQEVLQKYKQWFQIEPQLVACDLQPDFSSTHLAESLSLPLIRVQHHHAHTAAIMSEHDLDEPVLGVSYDGTGYGSDQNIWGGEILIADYADFERPFHLEYMPLPGGDAAIRHPARIAFAYLQYLGIDTSFIKGISELEKQVITKQLTNGFNLFYTSSMGRLFDCVAAMLGLYPSITFEAQSAMALQFLCDPELLDLTRAYSYALEKDRIKLDLMLQEISEDIQNKVPNRTISTRFHRTILEFTLTVLREIRNRNGLNKVVLSGGVMQNSVVLAGLDHILSDNDFKVFLPQKLTPNDGSIAVGQIFVANRKFKK